MTLLGKLIIGVIFFTSHTLLQASSILLESDLISAIIGGSQGRALGGKSFLKVENDTVHYQIWIGQDSTSATTASFLRSDGQTQNLLLGEHHTVAIHGCHLSPRNPFLPLSQILIPITTCDAFILLDFYEGILEDSEAAEFFSSELPIEISISSDNNYSDGPFSGNLTQVPEPSSALLALTSLAIFTSRRSRT